MKKETYDKLKEEFPIILTATSVALLSSTLYYATSKGFFATLISAFYSFVAISVVYLIFWINYRASHGRRHIISKIRNKGK